MRTWTIGTLGLLLAAAGIADGTQRRVRFTEYWRFLKGDAPGAGAPAFDDSSWRALDLPHDWAIEGPFDRTLKPHAGALPYFGAGWYRKHFRLAAADKGRYVSIEFHGAMSNSRVWLNGVELGGRPYGYIGFSFDLTPHLRARADNVIAVKLTPEDQSSRCYPGAGIYRNVWLDLTGLVHVGRWGTYIVTPEVADARAVAAVRTTVRNRGTAPATVVLQTTVLSPGGKQVARNGQSSAVPAGGEVTVEDRLTIERPERWDGASPRLYRAVTEVLIDGLAGAKASLTAAR